MLTSAAHLSRRQLLRAAVLSTAGGLLAACAPSPAAPPPTSAPTSPPTSAPAPKPTAAPAAPAPAATTPPAPPPSPAASPAAAGSPSPSGNVAPPFTGTRTAVKAVIQGRPDQAPFELAFRRGYFTQQGLDVEPVLIPTGAEALQALATNQVQFGPTSPSAALFNALARGVDIKLVADGAHLEGPQDTTLSIVVRQQVADQVKSMADLKGRNFGVGGAPGSVGEFFVERAAQKDGITASDMNLSFLPLGDLLAALGGGRVDAGMLTEPVVTQTRAQGLTRVLYPGGAIIPGSHLAVFVFSAPFAAQTDVATRFLVALLQGIRDWDDAFFRRINRDAAIDLLVQYLSLKDRKIWEDATPQKIDLNGRINVDDLRTQAEFYIQRGQFAGPVPDFSKHIDTRFAESAVRTLGAR